jgi:hypothetical protein
MTLYWIPLQNSLICHNLSFQIHVHLPNKTVKEGKLLFFDNHYSLALLEIAADMPLLGPSFSSSPEYGDKVFVLARDECSLLIAREASVLWLNESYLDRNYYLYLSCEPPQVLTLLLGSFGVFLPDCSFNSFVHVQCRVLRVEW